MINTSTAQPKCFGFGKLAKEYCNKQLPLRVMHSMRGFYIGTMDEDMPCSRESVEYFKTEMLAGQALARGAWTQKLHP